MNKFIAWWKAIWASAEKKPDDNITIQDGGLNTGGLKDATTLTKDGELK